MLNQYYSLVFLAPAVLFSSFFSESMFNRDKHCFNLQTDVYRENQMLKTNLRKVS